MTIKTNDRITRTSQGSLVTSGLRNVIIAATPVALFLFLLIVAAPVPAAAHPNDPENRNATKCPGPTCTCGSVVTGKVIFVADMMCMNTDGLIVGANNTNINLSGFRLQCTDPAGFRQSCQGGLDLDGPDIGINTNGYSYVQINGSGSIVGFDTGIWIPSGVHIQVHKLNISGPDAIGGVWSAADLLGAARPETRGILVENVPCHCGGPEVLIHRNSVDNHTQGILLNAAHCLQVESNFVHDINSGSQEFAPGESHGISLQNAQSNKVYNNLMIDNGINVPDDSGIVLAGANTKFNRIANNNVSYNNGDGILAKDGASGNRISKNIANLNTSTEPLIPMTSDPNNTRVFYDLADRSSTVVNTWETNNTCETEGPSVPGGVCNPGETAPPPTP